MVLVTKPDSNNPLGTYVTAGWKAMYGCGLLLTNVSGDVPHCLNLRTKSTFI